MLQANIIIIIIIIVMSSRLHNLLWIVIIIIIYVGSSNHTHKITKLLVSMCIEVYASSSSSIDRDTIYPTIIIIYSTSIYLSIYYLRDCDSIILTSPILSHLLFHPLFSRWLRVFLPFQCWIQSHRPLHRPG